MIKEDNYLLPGYDSYDIQRMILDRSNVTELHGNGGIRNEN